MSGDIPGPRVSGSGAVATEGGQVNISGTVASGRDTFIDRLTVLVADRAPIGDGGLVVPGHAADICPYPGIEAFTSAQARFFHGREADAAAVLDLVVPGRLGAVIGSSGSGKSSLLAAAVGPALAAGGGDRPRWAVVPFRPGRTPLLLLAERLAELVPGSSASVVADQIRLDPAAFAMLGEQAARRGGRPLVWLVDQFEEVFAPGLPPQECAAVLAALRPGPGFAVLLAMRSDFYAALDADPELAGLVAAAQHRLTPPGDAAIRAATLKPAEQVGLRVQPELLAQVVTDARASGGALPFVAVALQETWRNRSNGFLTVTGYLQAGGVARAIEQTAEAAWSRLAPADRSTAQRMLMRMADVSPDGTATRRRLPATEFITILDDESSVLRVLETLVRSRLVTVDGGSDAEPTVEIAHEALFRAWPLLRGWLSADRDAKRLQDELAESTTDWTRSGRDPAFLYTGARLGALTSALAAGRTSAVPPGAAALAPNEVEQAFIAASQHLVGRQRLRGRLLVALPFALVLALVVAGLAVVQQRSTARAKNLSDALQTAAESRSQMAANRDLAALLGVVGDRTAHTPTTWGSLIDAIGSPDGPARMIRPAGGAVTALAPALTADNHVVVGTSDRQVRTAPAAGGPLRVRFRGEGASAALAVSGNAVLSADDRGDLVLSPQGGPTLRIPGAGRVWAVALDLPRGLIAAAGVDGRLYRWRFAAGAASGASAGAASPGAASAGAGPRVLAARTDPVPAVSLALTPDGGLVAATLNGALFAVPGDPGSAGLGPVHRLAGPDTLAGGAGVRVAVTRDRRVAVVDGEDLRVWTLGAARSAPALSAPAAVPLSGATAIVADPKTGDVLVGTKAGELARWSVRNVPARQATVPGYAGAAIRELATDGHWLFAARAEGGVAGWDLTGRATPAARPLPAPGGAPLAAAYDPGSRLLTTGGADGVVRGYPPERVSAGGPPSRLGELPGTSVIAVTWWGGRLVAGAADGRVTVFGAASPDSLSAPRAAPVSGLAASRSRSGAELAIGWRDGRVAVVNAAGSRVLATSGSSRSIALSEDGRWLASGTAEEPEAVVLLWDLERGGPPRRLIAHKLFVSALAFSPDGKYLASGGDDRGIRLWSVGSGDVVATLTGHRDTVRALAFTRDSATLASAGDEGTIIFWDVATRAPIGHPLPVTDGQVLALAAAPDGRTLAATGGTRLVTQPFAVAAWRAQACAFSSRDLTAAERARYLPDRRYVRPC